MNRLANVLMYDRNTTQAAALHDLLVHGGYYVVHLSDPTETIDMAARLQPDLVIIGDDGDTPESGVAFAGRIKSQQFCADIPIIAICQNETKSLIEQACAAGLDDLIPAHALTTDTLPRIRPLVRLATMHKELRLRARVARKMGIEARDRVQSNSITLPSLLIIGSDGVGSAALLRDQADMTVCSSFFEAEELLVSRHYEAAILHLAAETQDAAMVFCSQVRNNPRLFNLPIVLIPDGKLDVTDAYRRGATRIVHQHQMADTLPSIIVILVRRQQLRWSIRSALNDSLQIPSMDSVTGLYNRSFLEQHLMDHIQLSQDQNRHLSVIFFSVPNISHVKNQFGTMAAHHLTQQIGQWITGLLRAEDLCAAYGTSEFCVVLPDTPLHEANVVMHRIAGILTYTDFAVHDVYQPVKVWIQVGCTDLLVTDSLDTLLTRARANLD